jgi:hypothetical protein
MIGLYDKSIYIVLLLYISYSIYSIVKGTLGLILDLDNLPKPHAFSGVPLHSGFRFTKFIATFRSVFSRTHFYNCCKNFFTVKTGIYICSSIIISAVIWIIFIKYGVNNCLFDYPSLYYLCVTTNASILKFVKVFIFTPLDINLDDIELMPKKLSYPTTIPGGSTALMTPSGQGEPSRRWGGLGGSSRIGAPLTDTPGLQINNSKDKLDAVLYDKSFKTKDKLKRLDDIEGSKSETTSSNDVAELGR